MPELTNKIIISGIQYFDRDGSFTLRKENCFYVDGIKKGSDSEVLSFVPGQYEELAKFLGSKESPEYNLVVSRWTPEILQAYKDLIAQNNLDTNVNTDTLGIIPGVKTI